jgi:signal transduction histidine kinase
MTRVITSQHRLNLLSVYVTDLELEVDRLRKQLQHVCQEGREVCNRESAAQLVNQHNQAFRELIDEVQNEVHVPLALDRVAPIAVRELIEGLFRWQLRVDNRPQVRLVLTSDCESIHWFPIRLRHILQNLIANAVQYSDPEKGEARVSVSIKAGPGIYEVRVTDNGLGMPQNQLLNLMEPIHEAVSRRRSEPGVGVAIVRHLVEQSGGELKIESGEGKGSSFVVTLPTFASGDFLE